MCTTHGNYIWVKAHYGGTKWVVGNPHQIPNIVYLKSLKKMMLKGQNMVGVPKIIVYLYI